MQVDYLPLLHVAQLLLRLGLKVVAKLILALVFLVVLVVLVFLVLLEDEDAQGVKVEKAPELPSE